MEVIPLLDAISKALCPFNLIGYFDIGIFDKKCLWIQFKDVGDFGRIFALGSVYLDDLHTMIYFSKWDDTLEAYHDSPLMASWFKIQYKDAALCSTLALFNFGKRLGRPLAAMLGDPPPPTHPAIHYLFMEFDTSTPQTHSFHIPAEDPCGARVFVSSDHDFLYCSGCRRLIRDPFLCICHLLPLATSEDSDSPSLDVD